MIADIAHGHFDLADWFLLFAIVAFGLALGADIAASRTEPPTAPRGPSAGRYVRPLALAGFVLVALALLVL
jgi:hypothetical protein